MNHCHDAARVVIPRLGENAKHLSIEAVNTEPPGASYFRQIKLIRYDTTNRLFRFIHRDPGILSQPRVRDLFLVSFLCNEFILFLVFSIFFIPATVLLLNLIFQK